jgi:hypothetical protein
MDSATVDIARRRPVWSAMSDLFLDTEVRWELPRVARVMVHSSYSNGELESIWRYEVTPEFFYNLWSVAGEWGGFRLDEVRLARRARSRPLPWLGYAHYRIRIAYSHDLWLALTPLVASLRDTLAARQVARSTAWQHAARAFFNENIEDTLFLDSDVSGLRGATSDGAERRAWVEEVLPIYDRLLVPQERASRARRYANVREMCRRAESD